MSLMNIDLKNTYLSRDGFTMIKHREMKFDEHCKAYPTEFIFKGKKAYCYLSPIPYDYHYTKLVYFVTGNNGDEFGQFKTKQAAIEKWEEVENQECLRDNPCDEYDCQECCEHDELENGYCINCGMDLNEELSARAYDLYKAAKYND